MAEISIRKVLNPNKTYYFVWVDKGAGIVEVEKTTGPAVHTKDTVGFQRLMAIFDILDDEAQREIQSYRNTYQKGR